jgi:hypothetical protein
MAEWPLDPAIRKAIVEANRVRPDLYMFLSNEADIIREARAASLQP